MKVRALQALDRRLKTYLAEMTAPLGRAERRRAAGQYLRGLLLNRGRANRVESLAARVGGDAQALQQFIGQSPWPALPLHTALNASMSALLGRGRYWVIDETAFPKQGTESVGVARQYCGILGQDRQLSNRRQPALERREPLPGLWAGGFTCRRPGRATPPCGPKRACRRRWSIKPSSNSPSTSSPRRCAKTCRAAWCWPIIFTATATSGGGNSTSNNSPTRWPSVATPGSGRRRRRPPPPRPWPPMHHRPRGEIQSLQAVAQALPAAAWKKITWREGARGPQRSRFARVRVWAAHRGEGAAAAPRWAEAALIEWPAAAAAPTRVLALRAAR